MHCFVCFLSDFPGTSADVQYLHVTSLGQTILVYRFEQSGFEDDYAKWSDSFSLWWY